MAQHIVLLATCWVKTMCVLGGYRECCHGKTSKSVWPLRDNLRQYNTDPAKFLCRYVTMDETWAHHFDPKTKQQSKQWKLSTRRHLS